MDVDMAMQLSRARRDTLHPPSSLVTPTSASPYEPGHPNTDLFTLPEQGIEEVDENTHALDVEFGHNEPIPSSERSPPSLHLQQPLDPSLLPTTHHEFEDPASTSYGLPTYQANVSHAQFDFARMEEFAATEKAVLGLNSPATTRFSLTALRGGGSLTFPAGGEPSQDDPGASGSGLSDLRPLRHRKLSQSNPNPRVHRKGIGGKMALFEANSGEAVHSLPARLALTLGGQGGGGLSYDTIGGMPSGVGGGGILNTGHDRPYRFSFYSNALSATIHARSLSELPAEGQTFEDLFSGKQHDPDRGKDRPTTSPPFSPPPASFFSNSTTLNKNKTNGMNGDNDSDGNTWWLDVQSPTDDEMKMLSKVFSIHPLTTEDILMEETREKIELFRNYYLVCFRSFDQDPYSPTHLEPLNMYIIVFREGILSFHFRPTPHPQNVRRRIKQLKDYISVTSDWISYALIDDITDAFGPLIQGIEYEVDSIDELVLILKEAEQSDMLRRIGTCRKKVMGLLRLMGNKADVVKGLAKRCNENWRVAPTSDIGLYLSDIQDHLITMTQNLNHYEKILSRSHSNYLAQISIEMTDANNQINDVLSKLTALGTVLIPMNLVTGIWGMNVHVPGQDVPGYAWFISIVSCLAVFAVVGGYSTYKFMSRK